MSGFGHSFEKFILLPSGLHGWITIITNELIFLNYDNKSSNTHFEYILQIIKKYFRTEVDILELSLYDIYYVWSFINSTYIKGNSNHIVFDSFYKRLIKNYNLQIPKYK